MLTVRPSRNSDLAALDALFARSYPRLLRPDYPPSVLVTALPLISRAQPRLLSATTYFVVEEEGAILGAGGWTKAAPGRGGVARVGIGNVRHLVTDDRHVRRGVARLLMGRIIATAGEAGIARLDCMSTLTAVPFYQAMGFVVEGPVSIELAPGIAFPAVAMWRAL